MLARSPRAWGAEGGDMAIGVVFEFPGVDAVQYDAVCRRLNDGRVLSALADWPGGGILAHVAGPTPTGWRVVDVWESEAAFQAFGTKLMPLLAEMNFPQVAPQVFPVHNAVTS
jgi:hypothetical protein